MSDEAVKKRLQRAVNVALVDFNDMGFLAERTRHPFFHIKANGMGQTRWVHISLDAISSTERAKAKDPKIEGRKEIWLHRKRIRRFDKYFY